LKTLAGIGLQGDTLKEQGRILAPRPVEGDIMRQTEVEWLESKTPSQTTFIEPIKWELKVNIDVGHLSREATAEVYDVLLNTSGRSQIPRLL